MDDESRWLSKTVRWAFVLRASLAAVLHFTGFSLRLAPDEDTYFQVGRALASYWAGDLFAPPQRVSYDDPYTYFYLNAVSYYAFGSILPLKFLNALVGASVCKYAFLLARELGGPSVARRTAWLTAWFPSLVLWSAVNIRDVWLLFLLTYLSWKSYQLIAGQSLGALVGVVGTIALINTFRPYLFVVTALPVLIAFLIGKRGHLARNVILASVAATAIVFVSQQSTAAKALSTMSLENLAERRRYLAVGAGSAFEAEIDISTPAKALSYLPIGLLYFWFSPFPWQMRSVLQFLSLPEMLWVYALTPSVIRGVAILVRSRLREALHVLLITALLTIAYAIGSGNIGTLYRHRAQSMVFYLMFAAVGIEARLRRAPERVAESTTPLRLGT